tara:strand:+ start:301 stop:951 length:651 start_codon:yes stop_codon:yes gene_type:complete
MIKFTQAAWLALALPLIACSNDASESVPVGDEPVIEELVTDDSETDETEEAVSTPDENEPDANGFQSAYSNLNLENCEIIESSAESADKTYQCDGYQNMNLFVRDGDGRFTLSAGQAPDFLVGRQPFNMPGGKVEWRLKDGEPHALIYRLNFQDPKPAGAGDDVLVVASLPAGGQSGCAQALVKQGPNQTKAARRYADMINEESDCPNEPAIISAE